VSEQYIQYSPVRRIRTVAKSAYYLRHVRPSVRLSAYINEVPTRRIYIKSDAVDFKNLLITYVFG